MGLLIFAVCAAVIVAINLLAELKRDLMMLQQNSYRNERYLRWLRSSGDTTSSVRLCAAAAGLFALTSLVPFTVGVSAITLVAWWSLIRLFTAKYKKPLVWTMRARRIYAAAAVICAAVTAGAVTAAAVTYPSDAGATAMFMTGTITMMWLYFLSHPVMLAANWVLRPVEKAITKRYYDDAAARLASMPDLKIIGITGSYGKTSTKHYLHRILSEKYSTLMTPGSFNTTLGVVRTVREHLQPYNEVFIVEMGAKQPGDIKEICDLVHPQAAIITAVGEQHLESFKTVENVQRTKFELVDALPADGFAVVNDDFAMSAARKVSNVECVRYSAAGLDSARYEARDIVYSPSGTTFTLVDRSGKQDDLKLETRLVGECNISNLMGAVIMARHFGVPDNRIAYAVAHIDQVEHRLSIKRTSGGITIIDDAFNSNPSGSKMALDVLARMTGGQRIVITPGMIELGERQEELNRRFGASIAVSADIAIVVGHYNREAITSGIAEVADSPCRVLTAETFAEAQRMLGGIVKAGDFVLYENDLPDTFK